MRIQSAKAKGRRLAQRVKDAIINKFPELNQDDITITSSSCAGKDLVLSTPAKKRFAFSIECKNTETASVWSWIKQAEQYRDKDSPPIVIFSRNHQDEYCVVKLSDLLEVLNK